MTMPRGLRTLVLTAHIATSMGWLGAVIAYITLDVTATISADLQLVRSAYGAMEVTVLYAIVPLAVTSVLIGTINALGTPWGLLRHYWVLAKFVLTLTATAILLGETQTIRRLAAAAASGADPGELPGTLVHSLGGLTVLLVILILSVYKPRGLTRYGWRKQQQQRAHNPVRAS